MLMITFDNFYVSDYLWQLFSNSQRNLFRVANVTLMINSDNSLKNSPRNLKEC